MHIAHFAGCSFACRYKSSFLFYSFHQCCFTNQSTVHSNDWYCHARCCCCCCCWLFLACLMSFKVNWHRTFLSRLSSIITWRLCTYGLAWPTFHHFRRQLSYSWSRNLVMTIHYIDQWSLFCDMIHSRRTTVFHSFQDVQEMRMMISSLLMLLSSSFFFLFVHVCGVSSSHCDLSIIR